MRRTSTLLFAIDLAASAIVALAALYFFAIDATTGETCKDLRPATITNALFFATQTVTTTGYGSDICLRTWQLQAIASVGSVFGSAIWAFFTASMVDLLLPNSGRAAT